MRYVEQTYPVNQKVADVRSSPPAWDRAQDVRMPETVDECRAALALVDLKIDALTEAGEKCPDRKERYDEAAEYWDETKIKLEWAMEVLKAGNSPAQMELKILESRYNELLQSFSQNTDTQTLIQILQMRERMADDRKERALLERVAAEYHLENAIEEKNKFLEALQRRKAELAAANTRITELDQENSLLRAANESLAHAPPPEPRIQPVRMMKETKDHWKRQVAFAKCTIVYIARELVWNLGVHTRISEHLVNRALHGVSEEMQQTWEAEELQKELEYINSKGEQG